LIYKICVVQSVKGSFKLLQTLLFIRNAKLICEHSGILQNIVNQLIFLTMDQMNYLWEGDWCCFWLTKLQYEKLTIIQKYTFFYCHIIVTEQSTFW